MGVIILFCIMLVATSINITVLFIRNDIRNITDELAEIRKERLLNEPES